jgi:hypothetical protein
VLPQVLPCDLRVRPASPKKGWIPSVYSHRTGTQPSAQLLYRLNLQGHGSDLLPWELQDPGGGVRRHCWASPGVGELEPDRGAVCALLCNKDRRGPAGLWHLNPEVLQEEGAGSIRALDATAGAPASCPRERRSPHAPLLAAGPGSKSAVPEQGRAGPRAPRVTAACS